MANNILGLILLWRQEKLMKLILENWRKFLKEKASDGEIKSNIKSTLEKEGGAAGLKALKDQLKDLDLPKDFDLEDFLKGMGAVGQHEDGDYILSDKKQVNITKEDVDLGVRIFLEMQEDLIDEKKKKQQKGKKRARKTAKRKKKQDACYHKVKRSAKVWPSAYASGRLVQCRKVGAANYGNKSKK